MLYSFIVYDLVSSDTARDHSICGRSEPMGSIPSSGRRRTGWRNRIKVINQGGNGVFAVRPDLDTMTGTTSSAEMTNERTAIWFFIADDFGSGFRSHTTSYDDGTEISGCRASGRP